jgi:hypothetical protein
MRCINSSPLKSAALVRRRCRLLNAFRSLLGPKFERALLTDLSAIRGSSFGVGCLAVSTALGASLGACVSLMLT